MKKEFKLLTSNKILLIVALVTTFYFISDCNNFVFFEYFKVKISNIDIFNLLKINTQFVSNTNQNLFCYLTVTEVIKNQSGDPELFKIYLPRISRVILQQVLLFLFFSYVLIGKLDIKSILNKLNSQFILTTGFGAVVSYFVVSIYVNFEENIYIYVFITFSIMKSFIIYIYSVNNSFHLKLFILCLFPFLSTGYGIPWFFDFLLYYFLFNYFKKHKFYKRNVVFILFCCCLILSFISPILNTPSLETSIINNPSEFEIIVDNVDFENYRKTYLERKDIRFLQDNINDLNNSEVKSAVINLSKNLKDVDYPNRWNIMVSYLPDFKYHIPSALWYFVSIFLFFEVFNYIKSANIKELKTELNRSANVLIFYPVLSIFLGISNFFNSFSELIFFLTRRAELLNFGEIQTWRGINTHYEVFGNLQLFSLCFFLLNYYLNQSSKNYLYVIFSITSTLLSQSRFNTLVLLILLFIVVITFYKTYIKELIVIVLITSVIFQTIPTFDRDEPFFIDEGNSSEVTLEENVNNSEYGFEFISDRLNRTLPWVMFASGYKPNTIDLLFGHGTGAYLNIVKFTERDLASGPHSILLQVLNKFGITGLMFFAYSILKLLLSRFFIVDTNLRIIIFLLASILLSLELKTDSLMLVDGVMIFLFNLLNISLLLKLNDKTSKSSY
tara:strand:- start:712 stop:2721 length:2010 start_codon:yes stop_codon:yes gene_type:complete